MDHEMHQAHVDLMTGMNETNTQMMSSMTIEAIDVAFVFSMIPHHQGAISMAKSTATFSGPMTWRKRSSTTRGRKSPTRSPGSSARASTSGRVRKCAAWPTSGSIATLR